MRRSRSRLPRRGRAVCLPAARGEGRTHPYLRPSRRQRRGAGEHPAGARGGGGERRRRLRDRRRADRRRRDRAPARRDPRPDDKREGPRRRPHRGGGRGPRRRIVVRSSLRRHARSDPVADPRTLPRPRPGAACRDQGTAAPRHPDRTALRSRRGGRRRGRHPRHLLRSPLPGAPARTPAEPAHRAHHPCPPCRSGRDRPARRRGERRDRVGHVPPGRCGRASPCRHRDTRHDPAAGKDRASPQLRPWPGIGGRGRAPGWADRHPRRRRRALSRRMGGRARLTLPLSAARARRPTGREARSISCRREIRLRPGRCRGPRRPPLTPGPCAPRLLETAARPPHRTASR